MAPALTLAVLMAVPVLGASPSGNAPPTPGETVPAPAPASGSGAAVPTGAVPSEPGVAPAPGTAKGLVVVLAPDIQDDVTRNAIARITGELTAAPFNVATQPVDPSSDVMVQVETAGRERGPVAAFAIVPERSEHPASVAVWVSNRITHTTTVQRVPIRAGDVDGAAAHLAIEAVELVRASMAGLWPGTKPPVVEAPPPPPPPPPPLEARFQVGVGVSVFSDFDASPTFWAPAVNVSYGRSDATRVRLSLVGLGPGTDVVAPDNSGGARLERAAAELGVVHAFRAGKTLEPLLSLSVGGQGLTAQGTGAPNDRLHRATAWSALAAVGAGALLAIGSHLAVVAEAQAVYLLPHVAIRVNNMDIAYIDQLTFNAEVGLLATF
jgi:hypothetical protein